MPKLKSFIHSICHTIFAIHFIISKRMYRNFVILCVGSIAVAAVSFLSASFSSSGKNMAFAYTYSEEDNSQETGLEEVNEEIGVDLLSDSLIDFSSNETEDYVLNAMINNNSQNEGQLFVADNLMSDIENENANANNEKEEVEKLKQEIQEYREKKAQEERKAKLMEERRNQFNMDSFTDEDYNNLLKIVEAEAGVNDINGKMMVANVILNRVASQRFPNTISGVIFARGQFSPVSNGRFYQVKVKDSTIEAVERALNGEDNSRGALFFMNRRASNRGASSWFDSSLSYLFSYGGHEYFK